MGVTQETINGYKSGRVGLSFERIQQIARLSKINPRELLGYSIDVPTAPFEPMSVLDFLRGAGIKEPLALVLAHAPGRWSVATIHYVNSLAAERTPLDYRRILDRVEGIPEEERPADLAEVAETRKSNHPPTAPPAKRRRAHS